MPRKLTDMQVSFLEHLYDILQNEPTVRNKYREAAIRAGYSINEKSNHVMKIARSLKDEITEMTKDLLVEGGPEAAQTMIDIMRGVPGSDGSSRDRMAAAGNILDRGVGVTKVEKMAVVVSPGLMFLPPKDAPQTEEE